MIDPRNEWWKRKCIVDWWTSTGRHTQVHLGEFIVVMTLNYVGRKGGGRKKEYGAIGKYLDVGNAGFAAIRKGTCYPSETWFCTA